MLVCSPSTPATNDLYGVIVAKIGKWHFNFQLDKDHRYQICIECSSGKASFTLIVGCCNCCRGLGCGKKLENFAIVCFRSQQICSIVWTTLRVQHDYKLAQSGQPISIGYLWIKPFVVSAVSCTYSAWSSAACCLWHLWMWSPVLQGLFETGNWGWS